MTDSKYTKCPSCKGKGRHRIPSDGYKNSKSWVCEECAGEGTFGAYVKRGGSRLEKKIVSLSAQRDELNRELRRLRALYYRVSIWEEKND